MRSYQPTIPRKTEQGIYPKPGYEAKLSITFGASSGWELLWISMNMLFRGKIPMVKGPKKSVLIQL